TNFRAGLLEHAQLLHTVADVLLHRLPDLGSRGVGAKSVGFPQFRRIALDGDGHRDLHAVHTPLWFPMEYSPSLAPYCCAKARAFFPASMHSRQFWCSYMKFESRKEIFESIQNPRFLVFFSYGIPSLSNAFAMFVKWSERVSASSTSTVMEILSPISRMYEPSRLKRLPRGLMFTPAARSLRVR